MSLSSVVLVSFWAAFLIDIGIVVFAFRLSRKMGESGLLYRTTMYTGASAFTFGLHHLGELYLQNVPNGVAISEGVEGIAAILLGLAVYSLYRAVGDRNVE